MKKRVCLFLIVKLLMILPSHSQNQNNSSFFRFFLDNDFLNMFSKVTDWGYTGGLRFDLFTENKKSLKPGIFGKLGLTTGPATNYTTGWSIMQELTTPFIIKLDTPDRYDYPYSGAIYLTRTISCSNQSKKINTRTEYIAGILGPAAFGKQSQTFIHKLLKYNRARPRGWRFQLPTDLLLNYNLTAEKQMATYKKSLTLSGGGQIFLGTMKDAISLYLVVKAGDTSSNFRGMTHSFFSSSKKKAQFLFSLKGGLDLVFYNALLDGGLFNSSSPVHDKKTLYGTLLKRLPFLANVQFITLCRFRTFSISFTQTALSSEFKRFKAHAYGNISLNFRL